MTKEKLLTVGELEEILKGVENKKMVVTLITHDDDYALTPEDVGVEKAQWSKDKKKVIVSKKKEMFLIG